MSADGVAAMIGAAAFILWAILLAWVTWVFFAACMNLKRVRDAGKLTRAAWCFGMPALAVGYVLDFLLNMAVATVLFMELPREPLLSRRLERLVEGKPETWRGKLALWLRTNLLDNIDPAGVHNG